ncbi:MAG TPA: cupin domain-containing protein, partial [Dehalococcoidia bacterium]|nr:cupin domain-containing protein [Dehalococcoidia bacterium]
EAIKYYLSGKGAEIIGDKRYEVEAGDVGFIPAHVWHGTQNTGSEPLRFLAVVQSTGTPLLKPIVFRIREDLREG